MADFSETVAEVRQVFQSERTLSLEWRRRQLHGVLKLIRERSEDLVEAVAKDLKKHPMETRMMEIEIAKNEAISCIDHLDEWTAPEKVKKSLLTIMDGCTIQRQPYGVVLLMGAWNYPVQLILHPICGAIAAGNCVVLKPSEVAPHTAEVMEKLLPQYLDKEAIRVVNGGVAETTALLKERFDYIFYTGNTNVGKIVMEAASKNLTPVTLELGGKSPCYIDRECDLAVAAHRVLWGRFANNGQTCIAPDYIMCQKDTQEKLIECFKKYIDEFYEGNPKSSKSYGRIINNRHFNRVKNLMDSGRTVVGGDTDESQNYISPTVLADCKPTDRAMQEEIFGPLLPIMPVDSHEEAIRFINSREKPLAMYIFTTNKKVSEAFINRTSSGGILVNDCLMHASLETLPFGGVGHSGIGHYHGKFSFDTFSHRRACLIKDLKLEQVNALRYPPYTATKEKWIKRLLSRKLKSESSQFFTKYLPMILLGLIVAVFLRGKL